MSQTGHGTASAEPNALGIDHDAGRFDIAREDGRVVIDATRKHLRLNGKPVRQPVTCRTGHWAGVRLVYDPTLERFDIDRALPSTIVGVAAFHTRHRF